MSYTRRRLLASAAGAGAIGLSGCLSNQATDNEDGENAENNVGFPAQSSFPVIYDFTSKIMPDGAEAGNLVPVGQHGHGWSPSPDIQRSVTNSDAFVYVFEGFQPWADDLVESLRSDDADVRLVSVAEGIELAEGGHDHGGEEEGHDHEEGHSHEAEESHDHEHGESEDSHEEGHEHGEEGHEQEHEGEEEHDHESEGEHETDEDGYITKGPISAFQFLGLSEKEKAILETIVPIAIEREMRDFIREAKKTITPLTRLRTIEVPQIKEVEDEFEAFLQRKEEAEIIAEKILTVDSYIDVIAYHLYDLESEEVEIIKSTIE